MFLIVLLSVASLTSNTSANDSNERYLVIFKEKADLHLIQNSNGKINRQYQHIPALSISIPERAITGLKNNPNVLAIEKDIPIEALGQITDWGIERTNTAEMWNEGYTGENIKVAVIDTGIAKNHEDLSVAGGVSFVSNAPTYDDDNGHGTHVAGIIAAKDNDKGVVGVAPNVDLYAVKVLDKEGKGFLSDLIAGVEWSITNEIDIINFSLAMTEGSQILQRVIEKAQAEQILMVAAAGNSGDRFGRGDTVEYPARYDEVIAVSAIASNNRRANFSATGPTVELAAPGVNIYSTYLNNRYTTMDGTSMAAPFVAGHLALLMEAYPCLSTAELRETVQTNALDLGATGRDTHYGYGLVQGQTLSVKCETVQLKTIHIEDAKLEIALRDHLEISEGPVTEEHLLQLTSFDGAGRGITDIRPLAHAENLETLILDGNVIGDFSPVTQLQNLQKLSLKNNQITSIAELVVLENIRELNLADNQIENISSLAKNTNLIQLDVRGNSLKSDASTTIRELIDLGTIVKFDSFLSYPVPNYLDFGKREITDPLKTWTVRLSGDADQATFADHINIVNSLGEPIEVALDYNEAERSITVTPLSPYEKNLEYYLFVGAGLKSNTDQPIAEPVQMKFY